MFTAVALLLASGQSRHRKKCSQVWSTAASSDPINDGMRDRGARGFSRVHSLLLQTAEGCCQLCFVKDVFNSRTCMLFPAQQERLGVDTMKRDT